MGLQKQINRANKIMWLTSGQALIFDNQDHQIGDLQLQFQPNGKNRDLLSEIAENCEFFFVSYWREWTHELTKEEFKSFLML